MSFNFTTFQLDFGFQKNSSPEPCLAWTIISLTNFVLCLVFGNLLYLLIIDFEHYGGDPKKRTVINRLSSFMCWNLMAHIFIPSSVAQYHLIFGPVGNTLGTIHIATRVILGLNCFLSIAEQMIIKCLMVFKWKSVSIICDEYFGIFLSLFNTITSLIFTISLVFLGGHRSENFAVFTGDFGIINENS